MDMKKKDKEKAGLDNYIDRLPEDLLLSILSRTDDHLKFLCRCSLVSKRFASTIFRLRKVSVTLPSFESPFLSLFRDMCEFSPELCFQNSEKITQQVRSTPNKTLKFSIFLLNFKELKSIHLEFMSPRKLLIKWKAKCSRSEPIIETFACVLSDSICKKTEDGFDEERENQEFPSTFFDSEAQSAFMSSLMCCMEWLSIVYMLITCNHSIEMVTVTDSEKQGKLVVRDEEIIEWRKCMNSKESKLDDVNALRTACLPELYLPLSGCVMKGVYFTILEVTPSGLGGTAFIDDAMSWEYDGDEKVLGEVVRKILTKHRDKIRPEID